MTKGDNNTTKWYLNHLWVVVLFLCLDLSAQVYNFKSFTVEEGMPQSQVFSAYQDDQGFMWFGTNGGGIARFDGKRFVTYDSNDGLLDNRILSIHGWTKDRLLLGSYEGVFSIFHNGKFKNFDRTDGLNASKIFDITTYKRKIYLATDNGIFIFDSKDSSITKFKDESALKSRLVRSLHKDEKNRIWVGTEKGVNLIYKDEIHPVAFLGDFPYQSVNTVNEDAEGNIWIGFKRGGVIKYDGEEIHHYTSDDGLPGNSVNDIEIGEDGTIWLSIEGNGIASMDVNGVPIKVYNEDKGLCNNQIFCLTKDFEGNLWMGTSGSGACLYTHDQYSVINRKSGIKNNIVLSSYQASNGDMWFGTIKGVSSFDGETITNYNDCEVFHQRITSITEGKNNHLWMTTYEEGLIEYDGKKFNKRKDGVDKIPFISSYRDVKQNLWFGTFGHGLFLKGENGMKHFTPQNSSVNHIIYCFKEDLAGNLLIGTEKGVQKYNGKNFVTDELFKNVDFPVHTIATDSKGGIWISGDGKGVYYCNPESNDKSGFYDVKHGVLDQDIVAMAVDQKDQLWLSTMKGLQRVDLNTFYKKDTMIFKRINYQDGFKGGECNPRAIYEGNDHDLWFGTINGVVRYHYDTDAIKSKFPRIFINDVRLGFESVKWSDFEAVIDQDTRLPKHVDLAHDQNHLTFDFIGINFKNTNKIKYQYKIDGIDQAWSPITELNSVTYPGISPGEYTFMVKAVNSDGLWSQGEAKFKFSIKPPFWKTVWFYALIFILVITAFILYSRKRAQIHIKSKKLLEQKVLARTVEIVKQKEIIELKNKDITDSIRYAKRIQEAILPIASLLRKNIPESFIYYNPKDIVSGDFYWYARRKNKFVLAAVDCTGHGVPGALMSVIGNSILKDVVKHNGITDPAKVITRLNDEVLITLKQRNSAFDDHDGMDIALVEYDLFTKELKFSGANRPMYLVRNGELSVIKGDMWSIGGFFANKKHFSNTELALEEGDMIYLTSDGYADQFGGPNGKKFKTKQLKELLVNISSLPVNEQRRALQKAHLDWIGREEQVDDILVIGFRVTK